MPKKKYLVDLSADERETLQQLVRRGKHSSRKVTRARILLLASGGATDEQIVAALSCGINTVERTRRRFVEESLGCRRRASAPWAGAEADGQARSASDRRRLYACATGSRPLDAAAVGRQGGRVGFCLLDCP